MCYTWKTRGCVQPLDDTHLEMYPPCVVLRTILLHIIFVFITFDEDVNVHPVRLCFDRAFQNTAARVVFNFHWIAEFAVVIL